MKTNYITLIIVFFPFIVFSQFQLRGAIKDSISPIEYANVVVRNKVNQIVTGSITNKNGEFKIPIKKGDYKIMISFLGFENWTKNISVNENMDLGLIILKEASSQLEEVVVTGQAPLIQQKADRLIFNVESTAKPIGGSAFDVLKYVPMVIANGNDLNILGKDGVSVLVNDKPVPLSGDELINYLSSLGVDDISKVEVFRTPPAKYDAEGNIGMLNIILKPKEEDAYNGSVSVSTTQRTFPTGRYSGNLNLKKGKLSLFSNASYTKGESSFNQRNNFLYPSFSWLENRNRKYVSDNLNFNLNIDYQISPKTNIGIQYFLGNNKPSADMLATTEIINNTSGFRDSLVLTDSRLNYIRKRNSYNINSVTQLEEGKKISFSADYINYIRSDRSLVDTESVFNDNTSSELISISSEGDQAINLFSAKIDFELPIKKSNISFGGKVSFANNDSRNNFALAQDTPQINLFEYKENIQSLYFNINKELKNWSFQAGLRLETNQSNNNSIFLNQIIKRDFTRLFPTINVSKVFNEKNILAFSYNRRIQRPSYKKLDPFRIYFTSVNFSEGNPFLLPSFFDNFRLTYIHKKLYSSLFYKQQSDGEDSITFLSENDNSQINRPLNFFILREIGISENLTLNPFGWWQSNNQMNLSFIETKSSIQETRPLIKANTLLYTTSNIFTLNKHKTLQLELDLFYKSSSISGSYQTTSFGYMNFGLRASLLKNKLSLSLKGFDLLRTYKYSFINEINGIKFDSRSYNDIRRVTLTVSYNFGTSFKRLQKSKSNDEENRRL